MIPSPLTYALAKRLRSNMTEAERRLWFHLRANRLNGHKFYRQVPIGPYVVDFINHEIGLVIEVDGATHGATHELIRDERRTRFLENQGMKVMRVGNHDVFTNINGVCDGILLRLEELKRGKKD